MAGPGDAIRILIVGEGPDDVGVRRRSGAHDLEEAGAAVLQTLVARLLDRPGNMQLSGRALARTHRKGLDRRVHYHLSEAHRAGVDGVVVVVDRDRTPGHERLQELRRGRDQARADHNPVPAALGVAIECLEAWLLGDIDALRTITGKRELAQPPAPESLTGAPGTANHPKQYLDRCLQPVLVGRSRPDLYRELANELEVALVEKTCPAGFQPFAGEVRSELGPICLRSA